MAKEKEVKPKTVCYCMGITEEEIVNLSRERKSFIDVKGCTSLATACGRCEDHARAIYKSENEK